MSNIKEPNTIYRKDYRSHDFQIPEIALHISLDKTETIVKATSKVARHPQGDKSAPLRLNGTHQKIQSIQIDGQTLKAPQYDVSDDLLTIRNTPDAFELEIVSHNNPSHNLSLIHI